MGGKMTDTQKRTSGQAKPMAGFNQAQAAQFGMLGWFGTAMIESATRAGAEFTEFLNERIKEDVKTQHALLNCRDMDRLAEIQAGFLKTAVEQYAAETGKLMNIGNAMFEKMKSTPGS